MPSDIKPQVIISGIRSSVGTGSSRGIGSGIHAGFSRRAAMAWRSCDSRSSWPPPPPQFLCSCVRRPVRPAVPGSAAPASRRRSDSVGVVPDSAADARPRLFRASCARRAVPVSTPSGPIYNRAVRSRHRSARNSRIWLEWAMPAALEDVQAADCARRPASMSCSSSQVSISEEMPLALLHELAPWSRLVRSAVICCLEIVHQPQQHRGRTSCGQARRSCCHRIDDDHLRLERCDRLCMPPGASPGRRGWAGRYGTAAAPSSPGAPGRCRWSACCG